APIGPQPQCSDERPTPGQQQQRRPDQMLALRVKTDCTANHAPGSQPHQPTRQCLMVDRESDCSECENTIQYAYPCRCWPALAICALLQHRVHPPEEKQP